jgi:hypothetical protein
MKLKRIVLAALAGTAATAAAPVFADNGWHNGHGYRDDRHHGYHYAPRVIYARPPVVYAPPRVVYAPPPVAYYPAPAYPQAYPQAYYSAPAPVYAQPGLSIRFRLPL